jgi:hypothetical protein
MTPPSPGIKSRRHSLSGRNSTSYSCSTLISVVSSIPFTRRRWSRSQVQRRAILLAHHDSKAPGLKRRDSSRASKCLKQSSRLSRLIMTICGVSLPWCHASQRALDAVSAQSMNTHDRAPSFISFLQVWEVEAVKAEVLQTCLLANPGMLESSFCSSSASFSRAASQDGSL